MNGFLKEEEEEVVESEDRGEVFRLRVMDRDRESLVVVRRRFERESIVVVIWIVVWIVVAYLLVA